MNDFERELLVDGLDELSDSLDSLERNLEHISSDPNHYLDSVLRELHSLKGNSKAIGLEEISRVTHQVEDIVVEQNQLPEKELSSKVIDLLLKFHFVISEGIEKKKKDLSFVPDLQVLFDLISERNEGPEVSKDLPRVLIAEDNKEVAEVLKIFIENFMDAHIDFAFDGMSAFNKAIEKKYQFILTDHQMPELFGTEFIEKTRLSEGKNRDTPIILVTSFKPKFSTDPNIVQDTYFLYKPIDEKKLQFFIKCCLASGTQRD